MSEVWSSFCPTQARGFEFRSPALAEKARQGHGEQQIPGTHWPVITAESMSQIQ